MSRLTTSFVLGYHGCDAALALAVVLGERELFPSKKDYDWLGPGTYFWESNSQRAYEWACEKVTRGNYKSAGVIGAVIDLRNCLDLANRDDIALIQSAFESYRILQQLSEVEMPVNRSLKNAQDNDRKLRFLDCAVITHLHKMMESFPPDGSYQPFDTVRGTFAEGAEAFPGCGFNELSHTQIAVKNTQCILGYFLPRTESTVSVTWP